MLDFTSFWYSFLFDAPGPDSQDGKPVPFLTSLPGKKRFRACAGDWALLRISFFQITSHPGSLRLRGPGSRILFTRFCYLIRCAAGNICRVSPPVIEASRREIWGRVLEGRTRLPSLQTFLEKGY